jgi:hypothetical protein
MSTCRRLIVPLVSRRGWCAGSLTSTGQVGGKQTVFGRYLSNEAGATAASTTSSTSINVRGSDAGKAKLWGRSSNTMTEWAELKGCRAFTNRKDVENMLKDVNYESVEVVLDTNLNVTDRWAVKFADNMQTMHEVKKFNEANKDGNKNMSSSILMISPSSNFKPDVSLASCHGIDNTCIRMNVRQPNVGASDLMYLFESFQLHPERPITIIQSGRRLDPLPVQKRGWHSTLYVVQFANALEAERAVFEKSFTVISGVRTSFLWYDI